jgi:Adenylate and Guanylate cyclase catalytic domain
MAYRWTENLTGEGEAQERGIVGETPNLAARVQALAEPSSVVIGASTHRLLGNRFALRSLGLHDLKGFADLVEAWVVEGVSVAESRFESARQGGFTAFVGREHEHPKTRAELAHVRNARSRRRTLSAEPRRRFPRLAIRRGRLGVTALKCQHVSFQH